MNVQVTSDRTITIPLNDILGSFRTFGPLGPVYEVLSVAGPATGSNVQLSIRVVTTGEELSYPLLDILADPLAR